MTNFIKAKSSRVSGAFLKDLFEIKLLIFLIMIALLSENINNTFI